jgi:hypothetical protein
MNGKTAMEDAVSDERVGGECAIGCAPEKKIVLASVNEPVTSGLPSARQNLREFSSKSRLHLGHRLISSPENRYFLYLTRKIQANGTELFVESY